MGFGLWTVNALTGEIRKAAYQGLTECPKHLDSHSHFDPYRTYLKDFKRLSCLELITVKKELTLDEALIAKLRKHAEEKKVVRGVSLGLDKVQVDSIVQIKISFIINVSEEKRLCPLEARLNPEWRCKEWDEERSETFTFDGHTEEELG